MALTFSVCGGPPSGLFAAAFAAVGAPFGANCAALLLAAAAFAVACDPQTVEPPTLAAFDLPKCQEQFLQLVETPKTSEKVNNQMLQNLVVSQKKSFKNNTEIPREDAHRAQK